MNKTRKKYRKFFLTLTLVFVLCMVYGIVYADMTGMQQKEQEFVTLQAVITEVTVFPDRARVIRTASKFLSEGDHLLIFDRMPEAIEENSIQVSGTGPAVLKEVSVKKTRFTKIPVRETEILFKQKKNLEDQIEMLDDRINQINKEKKFLDEITKKLTGITEKSEPSALDPDKWIKMVSFYRSKLETLDKEIRDTERSKEKLEEQMEQIEWKIDGIEELNEKMKYQVSVKVFMKKQGNLSLNLSYVVGGPRWVPIYDLHVFSQEKRMRIRYNAFIKQQTNEDWDNVSLKLSTAKPGIGDKHPDLSPWYIGLKSPLEEGKKGKEVLKKFPIISGENVFQVDGADLKTRRRYSDAEMEEEIASVEAGSTSVVFAINGKSTIKSSKSKHKVTIMVKDFPVHFRYSTVPKLKPYAYLKAKVKNNTDYPLLAGEGSVFLDNGFITHSKLKPVAPGQEFWTFLGVDEGIHIKYKVIEPYNENKGLFKKKNKLIYKRFITIKYLKKAQEELVVWDQLPISKDEAIKIQLIEPEVKRNTHNIKITEQNLLEWFFKPEPGEEIKIPLKFSVEYGKDSELEGHLKN